jgi:putative tryptophan/tyrosine transport system substrate-binding protein
VQQQTSTIPIVLAVAGDVLANGIVKNIARPEGNITGATNLYSSISGKWVELLKEAAPRLERVALVHSDVGDSDSFSGVGEAFWPAMEEAARVLALKVVKIRYRNPIDIVRGIDAFAAEPNGSLILVPPAPTAANRETIIQLAAEHRLPSFYPFKGFTAAGGLMAYGADNTDLIRRATYFVDRILRGAKVSELPVEFPTKFELSVNLKTAKAIGLTIPEPFLVRADEVIE